MIFAIVIQIWELLLLYVMIVIFYVGKRIISINQQEIMPETDAPVKHDETVESSQLLHDLCEDNALFYETDGTTNGRKLRSSFSSMQASVDEIRQVLRELSGDAVSGYDFDEETPANGYRSFARMADAALKCGLKLNETVRSKRGGLLFRKAKFAKRVESCAHLLAGLCSVLKILTEIRRNDADDESSRFEERLGNDPNFNMAAFDDAINQCCFHGRYLGFQVISGNCQVIQGPYCFQASFQFCDSMRASLRFISTAMAIYSEGYYNTGCLLSKAATSCKSSFKYLTDPEEKAKRIVAVLRHPDIDFCKRVWTFGERSFMKHLPKVVGRKVAVSKIIRIPLEPLSFNVGGKEINVPIPTSYVGKKPVQARLICWKNKKGMTGRANNATDPPSRGLFFHCHGGGFISQTSRSHETYLRQWASVMDVPILSIDYSLAPNAPFPRALEEVTYAFCWALKNSHLLGSTGERIVAGGDSAGANLVAAMSLNCSKLGVPLPNGLFLAYAALCVNMCSLPARLLCFMDNFISYGFLVECIKAYRYIPKTGDQVETKTESQALMRATATTTTTTLPSEGLEKVKSNRAGLPQAEMSSEKRVDRSPKARVSGDGADVVRGNLERTSTRQSENYSRTSSAETTDLLGDSYRRRCDKSYGATGSCDGLVQHCDVTEKDIFTVVDFKNPYVSPIYASDEMLRSLPPVKLVTTHMDPCLDECVIFARKLRKVNNDVTLDVVENLPHGFLNFSTVSKEAYDAAHLCCQKILELLDLQNLPPLV